MITNHAAGPTKQMTSVSILLWALYNRAILEGLSLLNTDHSELKLYLSLPPTSWESNPLTF